VSNNGYTLSSAAPGNEVEHPVPEIIRAGPFYPFETYTRCRWVQWMPRDGRVGALWVREHLAPWVEGSTRTITRAAVVAYIAEHGDLTRQRSAG
jgi:hypothetical protein